MSLAKKYKALKIKDENLKQFIKEICWAAMDLDEEGTTETYKDFCKLEKALNVQSN